MLGSLLASKSGTPTCSLAKETPVRQVMSSNLAMAKGRYASACYKSPFFRSIWDDVMTFISPLLWRKKIAALKTSTADLDSSDLMGGVSPTKEMGAGGNS